MSGPVETILELPTELLRSCKGFAIDVGGTLLKIAYCHRTDWADIQVGDESEYKYAGRIRLVTFSNHDIDHALEFLKTNAHISRDGPTPPLIFTTGIGGFFHTNKIEKGLNIRIHNLFEFDCFVEGFKYLTNQMTSLQFLYTISEDDKREMQIIQKKIEIWAVRFANTSKNGLTNVKMSDPASFDWHAGSGHADDIPATKPLAEALPDMYPCLMLMFCSGSGFLLINPDGSAEILDLVSTAGRMFLGMGALFCGEQKSYDELIALAMEGNIEAVDTMLSDLVPKSNDCKEDDSYGSILKDDNIFNDVLYTFGQAASSAPESFRKEDLVRSLLNSVIRLTVDNAIQKAISKDVKHIFVVGSFPNSSLVRSLIAKDFVRQKSRMAFFSNGKGLNLQMHFVKVASHLGVLGALINNTVGFLGQNS